MTTRQARNIGLGGLSAAGLSAPVREELLTRLFARTQAILVGLSAACLTALVLDVMEQKLSAGLTAPGPLTCHIHVAQAVDGSMYVIEAAAVRSAGRHTRRISKMLALDVALPGIPQRCFSKEWWVACMVVKRNAWPTRIVTPSNMDGGGASGAP